MAADSRKTRKCNFSSEEINVLISTIMHNYDILYGENSKSFYHKEARSQVWNIVLEEVNKVSLDRRTLAEVKNKWKKCQYVIKNSDLVDNNTSTDFDELGMFWSIVFFVLARLRTTESTTIMYILSGKFEIIFLI